MSWLSYAIAILAMEEFVGAAVGAALWSPIGVAASFFGGMLCGVGWMIAARMGE
jgi:hypothetical protein